jgi:hypothetical protein
MSLRQLMVRNLPAGVLTVIRMVTCSATILVLMVAALNVQMVFPARSETMGGQASGTLTIDGKSIGLKYAYAMKQPNTFDADKTDIAILLAESPLPEGELKDIERLKDVVGKHHNWAFFKIDAEGKPIHEVIDHPSAGGNRLLMSGFTHAQFLLKALEKDRIEGSFETKGVEDFLNHKYQIAVTFSASLLQARPPEPLPNAKTGKALPEDGGEPGKAYKAYLKAIHDKDMAAIRKMAPSLEQDISNSKLMEMVEFMAAVSPKNPRITKGYIKEDKAVLYLEATVEGKKQYGTVELIKKGTEWKAVKENWSDTPPKK